MYNFENYLTIPILSTLIGIILFLSISSVGYILIKLFFYDILEKDKKFYLISPLIGSNFLLLVLSPIAYIHKLDLILFKSFSFLLILIFIIYIIYNFKNIKKKIISISNNKYTFVEKTIFIVIFLFFLISLSPVTHADSVAYHMLGGVNFLIGSDLLSQLLPSEIKLVGPGELIIALGLSLGSEQLGGILQFSSCFTIYYCFKTIKKNNISDILLLATITTPTFILLASSPKPQLLQIANVLLCSYFLYKIHINKFNEKTILKYTSLIIVLISINVLVKFSFALSSTIIFFSLFYILIIKKKLKILIYPVLLILPIIFFPKFFFMNKYFDIEIINYFTSSLPLNFSLYDSINSYLRQLSSGSRLIPTWIFFPKNIGALSDIIGPVFLSFLLFRFKNNKEIKFILFLYLLFIIFVLGFGQATSRFIFEGFIIIQMFLITTKIKYDKIYLYFKNYVFFQSTICILILLYFVANLTPGTLTKDLRLKVMKNNANGYELMSWVNNNLKKDEQIISSHRSLSLLNNKSYSLMFLNYLRKDTHDFKDYIEFLDKNNVKKILLVDGYNPGIFKNCIGEKSANLENIKITQGRNPLKKHDFGSASIYNIKSNDLKSCINGYE